MYKSYRRKSYRRKSHNKYKKNKQNKRSNKKLSRRRLKCNFGADIYGLQTPPVYSGVYPMAQHIISSSDYGDPMNRSIDFPSLLNVSRCYTKTII